MDHHHFYMAESTVSQWPWLGLLSGGRCSRWIIIKPHLSGSWSLVANKFLKKRTHDFFLVLEGAVVLFHPMISPEMDHYCSTILPWLCWLNQHYQVRTVSDFNTHRADYHGAILGSSMILPSKNHINKNSTNIIYSHVQLRIKHIKHDQKPSEKPHRWSENPSPLKFQGSSTNRLTATLGCSSSSALSSWELSQPQSCVRELRGCPGGTRGGPGPVLFGMLGS